MSLPARSRAIDASLFEWPACTPALKGSRCDACGRHEFPARSSCRHCGRTKTSIVSLPGRGKLWTWTLQRFMPKPPYRGSDAFVPFAVGYVELPGALRVEARLLADDVSKVAIGADVELHFYTNHVDDDGTAVINYAFLVA